LLRTRGWRRKDVPKRYEKKRNGKLLGWGDHYGQDIMAALLGNLAERR